jgi:hypothetical protein
VQWSVREPAATGLDGPTVCITRVVLIGGCDQPATLQHLTPRKRDLTWGDEAEPKRTQESCGRR